MIRNRTNLSYRAAAMEATGAAGRGTANLAVSRETSRAAGTARDMQQLCSFDVWWRQRSQQLAATASAELPERDSSSQSSRQLAARRSSSAS